MRTHQEQAYRDRMRLIRALLWDWAEYTLEPVVGLGYPSRTIEGRIGIDKEDASPTGFVRPFSPRYNGNRASSKVNEAIAQLNKEKRAIVYAIYLERMNQNEIMESMGIGKVVKYLNLVKDVHNEISALLK
jgi:DNA-directed RNA polymerase specialized sigma24 family protein